MSERGDDRAVFVIDEDPAIHKALCRIGRDAGFSATAFASSRDFFLWLENKEPNHLFGNGAMCIVLDAKTLMSGLDWYANDLVRLIPKICIGIPEEVKSIIEMLTMLEGQFVRRPFSMAELRECVSMAFDRYAAIARNIQEDSQISADFSSLTGRENEVFALVAKGHTNQEISGLLGISIKTVKAHRSKVMKKTKSKTIPDLVRSYEKWELLRAREKGRASHVGDA